MINLISKKYTGIVLIILLIIFPTILFLIFNYFFINYNFFKINDQIVNFKLLDINNRTVWLYETAGKNRILLYYSYECPSCLYKIEMIKKFYNVNFKDSLNFKLLNICIDNYENFIEYTILNKYDFDIYYDFSKSYNKFFKNFPLPFIILIDKNNRIQAISYNELWLNDAKKYIFEK